MQKIKLPVTWEMYGFVEVEADSVEDAVEIFNKTEDAMDLPNGDYVGDSFRLMEISGFAPSNRIYTSGWNKNEDVMEIYRPMETGDCIRTPRFLNIQINEMFDNADAAAKAGYTEPTHYVDENYDIKGKTTDINHMVFAGIKKGA